MKNIYEVVAVEEGEEILVDILHIEIWEELWDRKRCLPEGYKIQKCHRGLEEIIEFLLMIKEDCEDVEYLGKVCVDSGQILISDPCYVNKKLEPFEARDNHKQVLNGLALAFSFAKGDGTYGVYAKKDANGHIYKIEIE
ncbi:hypothetical protein CON65_09460 [Bacillus pseudomycoides]|uniref:Uncharacterized protein n=1 Tax=Bacillus pseudomycoides TaxID=64104 RepID=A0AA91ZU02_9BACI|nr:MULTISPECIES: hypothetical protein [Bacillus]PEB48009.1 hypothetical protein COO03_24790 [Bacillus sp. AFS098217]PED82887.1 hypothetical protein CON65_09460 [Bacillus pseudomycoides]PEU09724.1 hypothetical protein CN524_17985 [Bacillus sp. AFS019443]PEU18419.1 hypothetical protein CN525_11785 [Bacillus sp. AFS014408]PFW62663.1 hypothetical protein COL20_12135 [Bacillus sp. AFS075034]